MIIQKNKVNNNTGTNENVQNRSDNHQATNNHRGDVNGYELVDVRPDNDNENRQVIDSVQYESGV